MKQIHVKVARKTQEASGIFSYLLVSEDEGQLPDFSAGAHIDVKTPDGLTRQYSLCNETSDQTGYLIAVQDDPQSRGGSRSMHARAELGSILEISEPRNHFPIVGKQPALLIAGGIGITPIITMAETLERDKVDFTLHYCARNRESAAFVDRIEHAKYSERAHFHFKDSQTPSRLDVNELLSSADPRTHIYVCGPSRLTDEVLETAAAKGWRTEQLHREHFANSTNTANASEAASFDVKIASSGQTFTIPADKSVYEVLSQAGVDIPVSCESGVCGTCITRILEGMPDHRDVFLTDDERVKNDQFTPCCSRAHSNLLVLDL